ncbi:hypothetical protein [Pajaroellobacter abortibovis]|uniref:Uncharacterized protein n=1 Tax=Pajaroellobacter abortibovis TaxID=1882918 RepID=A0A1L6MVT8_9BACT|nr:hypothetical protein [Pajaroellobacter abortibovis]APR99660.1 hypothetical protein BCY86_02445 [Pajaroellobacter abortibovis]
MCLSLLCASAESAYASTVSSSPKGTIGGVLLGAELVMISESLIGVEDSWSYLIGGGIGAIGGGIGGYLIDQSALNPYVSISMLAGGLALIIPATVLTLNATRYRPSEDASEDQAPTQEESRTTTTALFQINPTVWRCSIPIPEARPMYSHQEQKQHGVPQQLQFHLPLMNVVF